jgi:hypothetical protein
MKLPFKSSPQAIRADPPCRTPRRTKPSPDEKKKHLPIDIIFNDHIIQKNR